MMKKIILFIIIITSVNCSAKKEGVVISEGDLKAEEDFYKKYAEDICNCTKDLIKVYRKIENDTHTDSEVVHNELKLELTAEAERSDKCIKALKDKHKGGQMIKQDMTEAALKLYCPDFYNMLKVGRIK